MVSGRVIVAVLTPPGRGAVATLSIVGSQATACVAERFQAAAGRPLGDFPIGRIVFGRWFASGVPGEEVVVCRRAEDEVEVHCHGGRLAVRAIVDSLVAGGVQETSWHELAGRQGAGRIEAEARVALAAARTERVAAILLDQWRGALRRSLAEAVRHIRRGEVAEAASILRDLQQHANVGLHLTDPWSVVLTGRPNVGKSSLINAILGFERSIVHAEPGTTRDVVTAHTALDGWPVELADTAGLRDGTDELETAGVRRAEQQLQEADVVVLVFDVSAPWTDADEELAAAWPGAVVVYNKWDLVPTAQRGRPAGQMVSAAQGLGIDELAREIARRLVPKPPPAGAAMVFARSQLQAVRGRPLRTDSRQRRAGDVDPGRDAGGLRGPRSPAFSKSRASFQRRTVERVLQLIPRGLGAIRIFRCALGSASACRGWRRRAGSNRRSSGSSSPRPRSRRPANGALRFRCSGMPSRLPDP